jgi:hypothetical protein
MCKVIQGKQVLRKTNINESETGMGGLSKDLERLLIIVIMV